MGQISSPRDLWCWERRPENRMGLRLEEPACLPEASVPESCDCCAQPVRISSKLATKRMVLLIGCTLGSSKGRFYPPDFAGVNKKSPGPDALSPCYPTRVAGVSQGNRGPFRSGPSSVARRQKSPRGPRVPSPRGGRQHPAATAGGSEERGWWPVRPPRSMGLWAAGGRGAR